MTILIGKKRFVEYSFKSEEELEELIANQSKLLFGNETIFIYTKRRLTGVALGNTVPDGFLFDLTDPENPEFYLVEVELQKHDFYRHIFPQITKFFGFFRSPGSQSDLVEKLFALLNADSTLKGDFKKALGEREVYKFLKDTCEESQNILLIIDGEKDELPEILNTYTDTWGKLVKILKVRKYINENESVILVEPDFVDIQYAPEVGSEDVDDDPQGGPQGPFSEEYHLDGVSDGIKGIYGAIKDHLLKTYPGVVLNPQKYYIGVRKRRNLAYLTLRKKKLRVVIMLPRLMFDKS